LRSFVNREIQVASVAAFVFHRCLSPEKGPRRELCGMVICLRGGVRK